MSPHPSDEPVEAEAIPDLDEEEAVDGEPVLEDDLGVFAPGVPASAAASAPAASPVVVQAVAAAATGFEAGAATLALTRRRSARRHVRDRPARRRAVDALPILGTRSFLIDIHMLRPDE